jgi:hypothetical protein
MNARRTGSMKRDKNTTTNRRRAAGKRAEEVRIAPELDRYKAVKTVAGRNSLDVGDKVARTLRGLSLEEVYKVVAKATGGTAKALEKRWGHLNPGMQRMNAGNYWRGETRRAAKKEAKL